MAEQIAFNQNLNLLGLNTGLTQLQGAVTVDYGSNTVTGGSLSVAAAGTLAAQTYSNFTLTNVGNDYTLTGTNALTTLVVNYTGQAPTTDSASVNLL